MNLSFVSFDLISGPESWWFFYPTQCDDLLFPNQSPIRLDESDGGGHIIETSNLPALQFAGLETLPNKIQLVNDGSGLTMRPDYQDESSVPHLKGGPLIPQRDYHLDHIDWHWGTGKVGSEHQFGNERFRKRK